MQASIAPPLLLGVASGALAGGVTIVAGGGWLLAFAAYSLVGASGLVASAIVAAPSDARAAARAAMQETAQEAAQDRSMDGLAPAGMATADIAVTTAGPK
jgi:cytochrome bd-type quinol oxidase subunit 2